jgi:lactoylglutathione lyase
MNIEHIAIWTCQMESIKAFYETYFSAQASPKYSNPHTHFESYFLSFSNGARIEIMQAPDVLADRPAVKRIGYAHLAFSVESREQVDQLTRRLEADGYEVTSQPRITGDGYYESTVLDPDGNPIELTSGLAKV